ncbi:hypothetical protein Q8A67_012472 [Cirrhinus molitorella]|uniref:C2H2-type domain-containing protein n=1 Tax=Cirrhinus molitorella TaxID=172907 RepID=A0AA88PMZ1_9TELE|nr:hypothetical protein Q8A67_012472 [Cirrhinus molitorella]
METFVRDDSEDIYFGADPEPYLFEPEYIENELLERKRQESVAEQKGGGEPIRTWYKCGACQPMLTEIIHLLTHQREDTHPGDICGFQSFQFLSEPPKSADVIDNPFNSVFSFDGMKESLCQLREKIEDFCKEEFKKISDKVPFTNIVPRTRNDFIQYSCHLTLDPNTVNKHLRLSKKKRVITGAHNHTLQDSFNYTSSGSTQDEICSSSLAPLHSGSQ